MTNENNVPKERALTEYSEETQRLVNESPEMQGASEEVRNETMALIEAVRRRAQSETQKAGEFSREKYLEAVRTMRTEVEKLNFDPEQIDYSMNLLQKEAQQNWEAIVNEVSTFGDRLASAAQAAWNVLTAPYSSEDIEPK
jgi:hypothetical protein